jgi:hypothetical protein
MQGSLPPLPHSKGDLLANSSWYTRHEKVPSSLGSPCPGHESKGRRSHFITRNSFGITERSFYSFPECHHWRRIMVISVLFPWFNIGIVTRCCARNGQSKHWDRKVYNFNSLVCQWNSQVCWCSERQHIEFGIFCDTIVPILVDWMPLYSQRKSLNGLYIHLDNARTHNASRFTQCLHTKRSSGYHTRLAARTSRQVTSPLVRSSKNSPNRTSLTGRI